VIIVSDTSPISNLVIVNHIHLLPSLFGTVVIPEAVSDELLANGVEHPVAQVLQQSDWLKIYAVGNPQQVKALEHDRNLDLGEASAIVLALELNATQLLIDERLGRTEAKRQGLKITGILGVLLAAKRQTLIPAVRPVMDLLIQQANFRISGQLYDEILLLAKEAAI
jgi:uncharacterized protein